MTLQVTPQTIRREHSDHYLILPYSACEAAKDTLRRITRAGRAAIHVFYVTDQIFLLYTTMLSDFTDHCRCRLQHMYSRNKCDAYESHKEYDRNKPQLNQNYERPDYLPDGL